MSDRLSDDQIDAVWADVKRLYEQSVANVYPAAYERLYAPFAQAKLAPSELVNVGAAVAWLCVGMVGERSIIEDAGFAKHRAQVLYQGEYWWNVIPLYAAPTPAAPPNKGVEDYFRCQVCAALGEHIDTDSERLIAAIIDLRDQCREPAAPLASKCVGYPDCDGDLIGEPHEPSCPAATGERGEGKS